METMQVKATPFLWTGWGVHRYRAQQKGYKTPPAEGPTKGLGHTIRQNTEFSKAALFYSSTKVSSYSSNETYAWPSLGYLIHIAWVQLDLYIFCKFQIHIACSMRNCFLDFSVYSPSQVLSPRRSLGQALSRKQAKKHWDCQKVLYRILVYSERMVKLFTSVCPGSIARNILSSS